MAKNKKKKMSFDEAIVLNTGGVLPETGRGVPSINFYDAAYYRQVFASIYLSLFEWKTNFLDEHMHNLIEQYLYVYGRCVIAKRFYRDTKTGGYLSRGFGVYPFSIIKYDRTNHRPKVIRLLNCDLEDRLIKVLDSTDFVVITTSPYDDRLPMFDIKAVIEKYSLIMSELDRTYYHNLQKLNMPILARTRSRALFNSVKGIIKELFNGALFVNVDSQAFGDEDIFTEFKPEFLLDKLGSERERVFSEFARFIGIKHKPHNEIGVYENELKTETSVNMSRYIQQAELFRRQQCCRVLLAQWGHLGVDIQVGPSIEILQAPLMSYGEKVVHNFTEDGQGGPGE